MDIWNNPELYNFVKKNYPNINANHYYGKKPGSTGYLEDRYAENYGNDSLYAQQLMNNYNNESAQKQMDFQEYMSNTAHQREVNDLISAGLNPQLSANAGAPAMVGAYAGVDNSPTTVGMQKKLQLELQKNELANQRDINKAQMENALNINKYAVDKSYQLGLYQAQVGAAAQRDAASMAAGASMYNGALSAAAARYAADQSLLNSREQRTYDAMHPSNAWQAGGTILDTIFNAASNYKNGVHYSPGNSSAK